MSNLNAPTNCLEENAIEDLTIVKKAPIRVIGIECRTSNAPEAGPQDIPKLWERFFSEDVLNRIPNKTSEEVMALYCDYEGDHTQPYTLVIGCPVSSHDTIPEGMVAKTLPTSSYAIFRAVGEHPTSLIETWRHIWNQQDLKRTYCGDFELYGEKFTSGSPQEVEVYIGLDDQENTLLPSVIQGWLDTNRACAICSPLPRAEWNEVDHYHVYSWGMDYACGSGIMEKNWDRIPTDEEIDQTIAHFTSKNLQFIWWSSAQTLEKKGFQFGGILTGIAIDISHGIPFETPAPSGLEIKIAQTEAEIKCFTELAADAFGMDQPTTTQWLALNDAYMKRGEQICFLAYMNEIPVGTVSLSISPTSAGIWSLTTAPEYRKQGIASALVHAALVEAEKRDYHQVMAILMPKGMAWGLFTKMGFKSACEFPFYVYGVSPEDLEK